MFVAAGLLIVGVIIAAVVALAPDIPYVAGIFTSWDFFLEIVADGLDFLSFWLGADLMHTIGLLLTVVIAVKLIEWIYYLVMWVLRKIPMAGIS